LNKGFVHPFAHGRPKASLRQKIFRELHLIELTPAKSLIYLSEMANPAFDLNYSVLASVSDLQFSLWIQREFDHHSGYPIANSSQKEMDREKCHGFGA
jgi:hypothetical protein